MSCSRRPGDGGSTARLCDLLTREEPGDWLVVASHFELAERHEEAAQAYRETAEAARRRGALEEARNDLAHAIDLIDPLAADHVELEADLRLRWGFLAMSQEGAASADAAADYKRLPGARRGRLAERRQVQHPDFAVGLPPVRGELARARGVSTTLRSALAGSRGNFRTQNRASFGMLDWFAGRLHQRAGEPREGDQGARRER